MSPQRKYDPMAFVDNERAKRQARLNKQRASKMERDVAAYLTRGRLHVARRTPQSGAGWIKGDNHVPLPYPPDFFLISCKMSQAQTPDNRAYIRFYTSWVDELERDVKAMRSIGCKFGIFVIRWFGKASGELIAFVDVRDLPVIENYLNYEIKTSGVVFDYSTKKNGGSKNSERLFRDDVIENLGALYKFSNIELVSMHLSKIHEALVEYDKIAGV